MNPTKSKKLLDDELKLSSVFPVTHFNSESEFETQNGAIGSVIKVEGVPFITELNSVLNERAQVFRRFLSSLDETVMVYVTTHRKKQDVSLKGEFSSPLAKRINDKYHKRFQGKAIYQNNQYVTILIKGNTSTNMSKFINWTKKIAGNKVGELRALQRAQDAQKLKSLVELFVACLSDFNPHLLGSKDESWGYSELMAFFSIIPNGGVPIKFKNPTFCPAIGNGPSRLKAREALYPNGHIGQYVSNKRIFLGTSIQFEGVSSEDSRFGALLSIKKYPQVTGHPMLDPLLELDCEFVATNSFAALIRTQALEHIRVRREKLNSAEDKALSQIEALGLLEDEVASERSILGFHHNTIMLLSEDLKRLDANLNEVKKLYAATGMSVVRELLGLDVLFLSQIPGNAHFIARSSLITSQNFADFCPLHNYQTGFCDENFLGSAVTLLETPSKTPVYFNFHKKGAKGAPSNGHTCIYAPTDAGKTTALNFLDSQMSRYNSRSFFLDRNRASMVYVLASGNSSYTIINPDFAGKIKMNPLMLEGTASNKSFLKGWLAELVKRPNESEVPSTVREQLNECVDYCFDSLSFEYRTLGNIAKLLPVDFPRWPELRRWLKGQGATPDGEHAWLFDNECDALDMSFDKVGIDVTYLMDEVDYSISTPVYMYLVHRIQNALDGRRPAQINIDEGWQILGSPYWSGKLKAWLATIRKLNGFVVFVTQSPELVIESALSSELKNNVNVSIYFPNPSACEKTYREDLSLTEAEFQIIKNNVPDSRLFLIKQNKQSVLCKLDLSALSDEVRVLSGNEKSCNLAQKLIDKKGADPKDWLEHFIERSKS